MSNLPEPIKTGGIGREQNGSAFDRFLATLVPAEPAPDDFRRALLYAALGSGLTLAAAAVLALLPSREGILETGFFAAWRSQLADLVGAAGELALPVAVVGVVLLLGTGAVALLGRRDGWAGALCVAQPIIGVGALGGAGLVWAALLAIVVVNLVIWVVLITLVVIAALALLSGMLAALAGG